MSSTVIADRFVVEHLVGEGGMGLVYRARDRLSGEVVALKLIRGANTDEESAARFMREARLLGELSHSAVVRYVAHGIAPDGAPFLAMEWLEGETLSSRLARGRLSVDETLVLAERVAGALGAAHAH